MYFIDNYCTPHICRKGIQNIKLNLYIVLFNIMEYASIVWDPICNHIIWVFQDKTHSKKSSILAFKLNVANNQ